MTIRGGHPGWFLNMAVFLLAAASCGRAQAGMPERGWEQAFPFLGRHLSWAESYGPGEKITAREAGAYCVGNGRIFTMLGLENPLWVQGTLFGPTYQEPTLGRVIPFLRRAGAKIHFRRQAVAWVADSGMVAVNLEGEGLAVKTWDLAPPGRPVLLRLWEVENRGASVQRDLTLELKLQDAWNSSHESEMDGAVLRIHQTAPKRETWWHLGFAGEQAQAGESGLSLELPAIPAGSGWTGVQVFSAAFDAVESRKAFDQASADPVALVRETGGEWQAWNDSSARLSVEAEDNAGPRWKGLGDLLEVQKAIFRSQQSHSGSFSPLIGYSLAWVRDNNGPILFWLKLGKTAEARAVTEFFHNVACQLGFLPPAVSVDRKADEVHGVDYESMGMVHSEVPSWVVLQHVWAYLADGDLKHVRARYPYLKRCLDAQFITPAGRMLLQRDETYLWTLQSRTFPFLGYPNGNFGRYAWTPDSSFEWIAAARGLAQLAALLGKKKDAAALRERAGWLDARTRELYIEPSRGYYCPVASFSGENDLVPFANVLFNPLWVGSAGPEDRDARCSVLAGLKYLKGRHGLLKSTPWNGYFVGMNPGQWLVALSKLKHPACQEILEGLMAAASPSGDFSEISDPDGVSWNNPQWGQGASGRLRPWEGGVNADAVLFALSGFEPGWGKGEIRLAPWLPDKLKSFSLSRLWTRDGPLDLEVSRLGRGLWRASLKSRARETLQATLELWVPEGRLDKVAVDGAYRPLTPGAGTNPREDLFRQARVRPAWVEKGGDFGTLKLALEPGTEHRVEWGGGRYTDLEGLGDSSTAEVLGPLPERKFSDAPVLHFFSSTMALKNTGFQPQAYAPEAVHNLQWLASRTATAAVEMDFSLGYRELRHALFKGGYGHGPRTLAFFDRGSFSVGPQTNKPAEFWNHPDARAAFVDWVENGGCLVIGGGMDDKLQKEAAPRWLGRLVKGEYQTRAGEARCLPAEEGGEMVAKLESLDLLRPGNQESADQHHMSVAGQRWSEQLRLPLWSARSSSDTTQSGIGFSKWLQFQVDLPSSGRYRVRVWLASHRNSRGMILETLKNGAWQRVAAIPDRPGGRKGKFFNARDFNLPEGLEAGKLVLRLVCPAGKAEAHAFSIQLMKADVRGKSELAGLLGFEADHTAGICKFGLEYSGAWQAPLKMVNQPRLAGLLVARAGKGLIIRTELDVKDLWPMFRNLLDPEKRKLIVEKLP